MALKVPVKLSRVSSLTDARYGAGMMVDLIGFPITPDTNLEQVASYKEIAQWLTGVSFIAEIRGLVPRTLLKDLLETEWFTHIQAGDRALLAWAKDCGKKTILRIAIEDLTNEILTSDPLDEVDFITLKNPDETQADPTLQLTHLIPLLQRKPVFLGFGVNTQNVNDLIERFPIYGLDLNSETQEQAAGIQDLSSLANVLEAIEVD